jgi:hypothetical protein
MSSRSSQAVPTSPWSHIRCTVKEQPTNSRLFRTTVVGKAQDFNAARSVPDGNDIVRRSSNTRCEDRSPYEIHFTMSNTPIPSTSFTFVSTPADLWRRSRRSSLDIVRGIGSGVYCFGSQDLVPGSQHATVSIGEVREHTRCAWQCETTSCYYRACHRLCRDVSARSI